MYRVVQPYEYNQHVTPYRYDHSPHDQRFLPFLPFLGGLAGGLVAGGLLFGPRPYYGYGYGYPPYGYPPPPPYYGSPPYFY
jgi:hypothetical protein